MAHAVTSGSKRKGGKVKRAGGLGGPGGRGSVRPRERSNSGDLPGDVGRLKPRALASLVKDSVERDPQGAATPYRRAMSMITSYANRESKTLKPQMRVKLAQAKAALREMFGHAQTSYGTGGAGKKRQAKPKAKSRRNPR